MTARQCNGCTACCYVVPVKRGLNKPAYTPCQFQLSPPSAKIGCAIYHNRPDSCRSWSCGWLINDTFPDELRPDRCGLVVDENPDLIAINGREVAAIQIWVMPGHEEDYRHVLLVKNLIASILSAGMVILWRLPQQPQQPPMAQALFMIDGKLTISPPQACIPGALGGDLRRMMLAEQLADKTK